MQKKSWDEYNALLGDDEDDPQVPDHLYSSDWKDNPGIVLEDMDHALAKFGLEIVMYETGSDQYFWEVAKRKS